VCSSLPEDWEHFKDLFKAIVEGNGKDGAHMIVKFSKDRDLTKDEEEKFVTEMDNIFTSIRYKKMSEIHVGEFLGNILSIIKKYRVKIEGNFATLCVSTIVLEGIGRQLDPDINILDASVPLLIKGDVLPQDKITQMKGTWEMLQNKLKKWWHGFFESNKLE